MKYNTNTGRLFLNQKNSFIAAFALFTATCASVNAGVLIYPAGTNTNFIIKSSTSAEVSDHVGGTDCPRPGLAGLYYPGECQNFNQEYLCEYEPSTICSYSLELPICASNTEETQSYIIGKDVGATVLSTAICSDTNLEFTTSFNKLNKTEIANLIHVNGVSESFFGQAAIMFESEVLIERVFTVSSTSVAKLTAQLDSIDIFVEGGEEPFGMDFQWELKDSNSYVVANGIIRSRSDSSCPSLHNLDVWTGPLAQGTHTLTYRFGTTNWWGQIIRRNPCRITGNWSLSDSATLKLETLASCPGDLDFSGYVDSADLGAVLGDYGTEGGPNDVDGNGYVDSADVGFILLNCGPCENL
jgi:hypothetical protein